MTVVLSDWELLAVAAAIERQHGERAPLHIAERIGALALGGDQDGVATWKAVAARMASVTRSAASARPAQ